MVMDDTPDDWTLLRDYADRRAHDAFARLVAKYADLVFNTAYRRTRQRELAEDITQAVFIVLARSSGKLSARGSLGAWLHKTTLYASANAIRAESRRRFREHTAAKPEPVESTLSHDSSDATSVVEEELHRLPSSDRQLLSLHYLEGQTMSQAAEKMGVSNEAARKRLSRALQKLRGRLSRRGIATAEVAAVGSAVAGITAAPTHAPAYAIASTVAAGGEGGRAFAIASDLLRKAKWLLFKQVAAGVAVAALLATVSVVVAQQRAPSTAPAKQSTHAATAPSTQVASTAPARPAPTAHDAPPADAEMMTCLRNLRDLQMAAMMASNSGRGAPADISSLLMFLIDRDRTGKPIGKPSAAMRKFFCPRDLPDGELPREINGNWIKQNTSYVYLAKPSTELPRENSSKIIIFHEKLDHPHAGDRICVAMADGHAETLDLETAKTMIEESKKVLDALPKVKSKPQTRPTRPN